MKLNQEMSLGLKRLGNKNTGFHLPSSLKKPFSRAERLQKFFSSLFVLHRTRNLTGSGNS